MAQTPQVIQDEIDRLDVAIASGAVEVQFQDRREKFDTADGLLKRRSFLVSQLATSGGTPAKRHARFITDKGIR